jgi:hypothetical protein
MRFLALLLFLPTLALAQPEIQPKDGCITVPLTLSAAVPKRPLSQMYFLPEYSETQPGERIGAFLNVFSEQDIFFNRENTEKRVEALKLPLAELGTSYGVENGLAYKSKYSTMMARLDQAARYTRIEWNEHFNLRNDGAYFLIPEVQKFRQLATALALRLRIEIKGKEFDKAIVTIRTMLGLAKTLETHPTLIAQLVGFAVTSIATRGMEELISQPGCPNLYWSFADLPTPFISLRQGTGGERMFIKVQFQNNISKTKVMSDKDVGDVIQMVREMQGMTQTKLNPGDDAATRYGALAVNEELLKTIRNRLTNDEDLDAEVVKKMSAGQLVLLEDIHRFMNHNDDLLKWLSRPAPEALKALGKDDETLAKLKKEGWVAPGIFTASIRRVKIAQARVDQHFAFLMTIEALRMHAALNKGEFPANLSDISVTVPDDPVSGKPFSYELKDGTATLRGTPAMEGATNDLRYSLTLRK